MTGAVTRTLMFAEAAEGAPAVARLLDGNAGTFRRLGRRMRETPPPLVVTCARGSSDHAATYGKYLLETYLGVPVSSAAPSATSLFAAPLRAEGALCIAISQSGRSPDLLATAEAYRQGGATLVALVNDAASPLAALADEVVPLSAGPERSVAATKSFITSLAALAALTAAAGGAAELEGGLSRLPEQLAAAFALDWSNAMAPLRTATNLFTIGRSYGLGIAQEAALKLKETCALHAEAFSSAEVRHGPMAIVGERFPLLAFATSDAAGEDVRAACDTFAARRADVLLADARGGSSLPALRTVSALEPILMIQSFYRAAEALSRARGLDPDAPPHLAKVTRTL